MNEFQENKKLDVKDYDVVVIGAGQAGLSLGFYLRRSGLSYVILDALETAGGAALQGWNSLRLFSPAQWSSLPGWLFPGKPNRYPTRDEVVSYLEQYEKRYNLPILRPVEVIALRHADEAKTNAKFIIESSIGNLSARAVVSAS